MVKRYEVTKAQRARIEDLLPGKATDRGGTARDKRLFVNGVLWVLALRGALVGPAGALWQVEERSQALHPPGQDRHPAAIEPQQPSRLGPVSLQAAEQDRAPLRQAQAFSPLRNPLRPPRHPFQVNNRHRSRDDLAASNRRFGLVRNC